MRTTVVTDENRDKCTTPKSQKQRWKRHFTRLLNILSEFDVEELEGIE